MGSRIPLRTNWPSLKTVLVVPDPSEGSTHGIQGIGDGDDYLVNRSVLDGIIKISTDDASDRALRLLNEQGLFVGISSGANVLAAERWIEKHDPAGIVITFLPDRGERYLSEYIC
jgi:cysteine synthase A